MEPIIFNNDPIEITEELHLVPMFYEDTGSVYCVRIFGKNKSVVSLYATIIKNLLMLKQENVSYDLFSLNDVNGKFSCIDIEIQTLKNLRWHELEIEDWLVNLHGWSKSDIKNRLVKSVTYGLK